MTSNSGDPLHTGTSANLNSYGQINPNLWNLYNSSKGSVNMCNTPLGLGTSIDLTNIQYDATKVIVGYSEIGYGYNLADNSFGNEVDIKFPINVQTFQNSHYLANVTYNINTPVPDNLPIDFAYDFWLEHTSGSYGPNDLEVMIWLYHNNLGPLLLNPLTTYSNSIYINNKLTSANWYINEQTGGSNTKLIQFILQSPNSLSGSIALDVNTFITEAMNKEVMNPSMYSIMGIELGTEYGSSNSGQGGSTNLNWTITNYELDDIMNNNYWQNATNIVLRSNIICGNIPLSVLNDVNIEVGYSETPEHEAYALVYIISYLFYYYIILPYWQFILLGIAIITAPKWLRWLSKVKNRLL